MAIRYFKDNKSYFKFIHKYKEKINIIKVNVMKDKVKVIYENKD